MAKPETAPPLSKSSPLDLLIPAALLSVPLVVAIYLILGLFAIAFPSTFSIDFVETQVVNFLNFNAVATFVGDGLLALVIWLISRSRPREDTRALVRELGDELRNALKEDREALIKALRSTEDDRKKKENGSRESKSD